MLWGETSSWKPQGTEKHKRVMCTHKERVQAVVSDSGVEPGATPAWGLSGCAMLLEMHKDDEPRARLTCWPSQQAQGRLPAWLL